MAIAEKRSIESPPPFTDKPTPDLWQPNWFVDVGHEVMVGIALDDGCYVVLTQTSSGQWQPITHIPAEVAKILGHLTQN